MKKLLLLTAITLFSCSLFAQWTTDTDANTLVAASVTGDMQSIGTSDGKTYVAFWHDVPAPQYYEMRLQLMDKDGNQLFGPEGMVVNNTVPMSSFTTIWSMSIDHDNNVYIAFNGTGTGNPMYAHKIAPDGTQLWGPNGISLGAGYDAKVLPLSSGGAIVSWLPGNQGVIQKVDANGVPVWANPVTILPAIANHKTSAGEMAELSNGDVEVILHDRGGFSPSSLPYVQRYDANGVAAWTSPIALSTTYYTSFNRRYPIVQDGDVVYFGYAGFAGSQPAGFLQRINPDGSLPWGINGSDFSTQSSQYEIDVQIAFKPGSDVVWAICEYTDVAQGQTGEYVQKFDKSSGARLLGDQAKEIYPISPAYITHQGHLQVVNDQPVFLISNGNSNGVFPVDLLAVYLDSNGDFAWAGQTRPMGTNTTGVKSRIQLNTPYNGQITAAWAEDRPAVGESRPYAQNLQVGCTGPTAGFTYVTNAFTAAFISTAQDAVSVSWDFGDNSTGNGGNPSHFYNQTGTYTVCQYAINSCGADTFCQDIVISCPLPQAGFTFTTNNLNAAFTSSATGAVSVSWDFGDSATGNGNNPTHTFPATGTYTVCQYATNSCGADTSCQDVTVMVSGVSTLETSCQLKVSPNPNDGECTLTMNLPRAGQLVYSLFTADGRLIKEQSLELSTGYHALWIESNLSSGAYYIRVNMNGESGVLPMVVR